MPRTPAVTVSPNANPLALDQQLCFALYATMLGVNKTYRRLLKGLDLTYPQYLVMLVLWEQDGLTVSAIGERLHLDSTTLTPLLKRLEASGRVVRRRSNNDERQVIVSLTDAGRELRQQAEPIPQGVAEAAGCSHADIAGLRTQLNHLRQNLLDPIR
jgi:MarR family transcriptional regulator, organic hydroperoxide resistance regulator